MKIPKSLNPSRKLEQTALAFGLDDSPLLALKNYVQAGIRPTGKAQELLTFFLKARSDTELKWIDQGVYFLLSEVAQDVIFSGYEWFSFKLPGGSYTPDFNYLLKDGSWIHVEVKASTEQAGYKDARAKLRAAATLNPWFKFYMALWDRKSHTWKMELIAPDPGYLNNLMLSLAPPPEDHQHERRPQ